MSKYTNGLIPTARVAFTHTSLPYMVPADTLLVCNFWYTSTPGGARIEINGIFLDSTQGTSFQTMRLYTGTTITSVAGGSCSITGVLFTKS